MACIKPPHNVTAPATPRGPTLLGRLATRTVVVSPTVAAELRFAPMGQNLSPAAVATVAGYVQTLIQSGRTSGPPGIDGQYQYQVSLLGATEFQVGIPGGPDVWADGIDVSTGMIQDAKFATDARSWYDPSTLGNEGIAQLARNDIDGRLERYREVIESPSNPIRGLELITTDASVAKALTEAMERVGVPGRVRIE